MMNRKFEIDYLDEKSSGKYQASQYLWLRNIFTTMEYQRKRNVNMNWNLILYRKKAS